MSDHYQHIFRMIRLVLEVQSPVGVYNSEVLFNGLMD